MIKTPQRTNQAKALLILKDITYVALSFIGLITTLNILDYFIQMLSK
jgi:hypothetical protein